MTNLHSDFVEIVAEGTPMTVRQVYDQAVTRGLIDKTEQSENSERQALRMIGQQLRDEEAEGDDGRA